MYNQIIIIIFYMTSSFLSILTLYIGGLTFYLTIGIICYILALHVALKQLECKNIKNKYLPLHVLTSLFILFSYLQPFLYLFAIPLGYITIFIPAINWKRIYSKNRIFIVVAFLLLNIRILAMAIGFILINSNPIPGNVNEIYNKLGVFKIAAFIDADIFEMKLINRRKNVNALIKRASKDQRVIRDIYDDSATSGSLLSYTDSYNNFNGLKWIKINSVLYIYSIGPDNYDDNITIIYDPTNGLSSKGDMVVQIK